MAKAKEPRSGRGTLGANALMRVGVLGVTLLVAVSVAETAAQTVPTLGYVANENADPKRLAALKKG
jgi:hypothetical protein